MVLNTFSAIDKSCNRLYGKMQASICLKLWVCNISLRCYHILFQLLKFRVVKYHVFVFNWKNPVAESLLSEAYAKYVSSISTYKYSFQWFKTGDFDTENNGHQSQLKTFEDKELKALLDENLCQTLQELTDSLNGNLSTISKCLME